MPSTVWQIRTMAGAIQVREGERGMLLLGALDKELDGREISRRGGVVARRVGQPADFEHVLGAQLQPFARGDDHAHLGRPGQQAGNHIQALGPQHVLEVIQDQQGVPIAQVVDELAQWAVDA